MTALLVDRRGPVRVWMPLDGAALRTLIRWHVILFGESPGLVVDSVSPDGVEFELAAGGRWLVELRLPVAVLTPHAPEVSPVRGHGAVDLLLGRGPLVQRLAKLRPPFPRPSLPWPGGDLGVEVDEETAAWWEGR